MKIAGICLVLSAIVTPCIAISQTHDSSSISGTATKIATSPATGGTSAGHTAKPRKHEEVPLKPFSHIAIGGGFSISGVNIQAATNVSRNLNLRGTGNVFDYSVSDISFNSIDATAKLNFASAGVSLDYYPFPRHGLRLSPGLLFYNQNQFDANLKVEGGTDFKLNGNDYISSTASPVSGAGSVGLHNQKPAFTITTGWGNAISRRGGHWSFPVELGMALIGSPTVKLALTSGQVCSFNGENEVCQNAATDSALQSDLSAQAAKYKHDLDPLKTFPIFSFGVTYNFKIR